MQISVINLTSGAGAVPRAEAQRVVRAINRQLREDFCPYWHISGQLRLDPESGEPGDTVRRHEALRGDAILYLMSSPQQVQALGYHHRHAEGVPFGFVFTEVSQQLKEDWSVTLSHEALELIADPDVNLLCKGPHPDPAQAGRDVFHWFELCDAVQGEAYEIDGVRVSNFVLPGYFTGSEERGGHNDFSSTLVAGGDGAPTRLQSFGTNPGGYVGFFDPKSQRDETYADPRSPAGSGARAVERAALKERLLADDRLRRKDRRALAHPTAAVVPAVAPAGSDAPAPELPAERLGAAEPPGNPLSAAEALGAAPVDAHFEAFALRLPSWQAQPEELARQVVSEQLGEGWRVERLWADPRDFTATPTAAALSTAQAWELCYRLRSDPRIERADPLFQLHSVVIEPRARSLIGGVSSSAPTPYEWSLDDMNTRQAWAVPGADAPQGAGVLIGHLDTGFTLHPEVEGSWQLKGSRDFVDDDADARDELDSGVLLFPSHGTGTGSVIASGDGPAGVAHVSGVAPQARLLPLRVGRSVIHLSMLGVTRAIRHASEQGCQVITMSLGGPFGWWFLHRAVQDAVDRGVLVLAAAGNQVGFVVYPAAFDEVIAVAASNLVRRPWSGSSRGSAVDVTAPGEEVWNAQTLEQGGGLQFEVRPGSGTSFATANVAGLAALWLAHHGSARLARYGAQLPAVFKQLLIASCRTPSGWDTERYGAGIVDAERLLHAELPELAPARGMRALRAAAVTPVDATGLRKVQHLFEGAQPQLLRAALSQLLARDDRQLDARLELCADELCMHLATDPVLRAEVAAGLSHEGPRDLRAAAPGGAAVALGSARARLSRVASATLLG